MKYLKAGQSFGPESFSKDFGFTGSSKGPSNTHVQIPRKQNEFNDGLAKGGQPRSAAKAPAPKKMAFGGSLLSPGSLAAGILGSPFSLTGALFGMGRRNATPMQDINAALKAGQRISPAAWQKAGQGPNGPPGWNMVTNDYRPAFKKGGVVKKALGGPMTRRGGGVRPPVPVPRGAMAGGAPRGALSSMIGGALQSAGRLARPMKKGGPVTATRGPSRPKLNRRGKLEIDPGLAASIVKHAARTGAVAAASSAPPPMAGPPAGALGAMTQGAPVAGMKKGGFIRGAIKHKGRETRRAQEHGISVHEQMVRDSHSKDPSLRGAGNLGLRLTGGDLHKGKKKG